MTGGQAKKLNCSGCDRALGGSSGYHLHHNVPATPSGRDYDLGKSVKARRGRLRVLGPEDLLDMAHVRGEAGVSFTPLTERIQRLRVGDRVKLCFLVKDREARRLPEEMRLLARHCESEAMLVKVTRIDGDWPGVTFLRELLNMPVPFHPRELQLGSRVRFTPAYIHSARVAGTSVQSTFFIA
jgi:hypothetical protein